MPASPPARLKIINLPHKMPVAWVYLTGWVTRDGTVQFREDVYKHDQELDREKLDETVRAGDSSRRCRAGGGGEAAAAEAAAAEAAPREVNQFYNLDSR